MKNEAFESTLDRLLTELTGAGDILFHEGKNGLYCIPLAHILYLQSDLKHVVIHTSDQEEIRFFSKLSQMEDQLDRRFVRIHKSYIVNSEYAEFLDKKSHLLRLSNKETLPVSDARYEKAVEKLKNLKR